jgi:hypothetical protein
MTVKSAAVILMGLFSLGGCATKRDFVRLDEKTVRLEERAVGLDEKAVRLEEQVVRLEEKIDRLLLATDRSALESIFEPRAAAIVHNVEKLDGAQRQEFEKLQSAYQKGQMTLYDVREKMVTVLGGGDREVYTPSGIVVRGLDGRRSGVVRNGSKLRMCRKLEEHEVPESIRDSAALRTYSWGVGEREGRQIMFPWEFTISTFTKEIVEPTARRTAQEFIRMSGEDQWNRPIYVKVEGEGSEKIRVSIDGESEIHLVSPDEKMRSR